MNLNLESTWLWVRKKKKKRHETWNMYKLLIHQNVEFYCPRGECIGWRGLAHISAYSCGKMKHAYLSTICLYECLISVHSHVFMSAIKRAEQPNFPLPHKPTWLNPLSIYRRHRNTRPQIKTFMATLLLNLPSLSISTSLSIIRVGQYLVFYPRWPTIIEKFSGGLLPSI